MVTKTFNPNEKEWQYFSHTFEAPWDFDAFSVSLWQSLNANSLYITNLNLFQDVRSVTYDYDENGNIKMSKDLSDEFSGFNYNENNQLISMTTPRGKNFTFEYDNIIADRALRGVSDTGISNETFYDSFGNPITTTIINRGQMKEEDSEFYKIRLKGTDNYLRLINNQIMITNNTCGHDKWILEKVTSNNIDYFKINHSIIISKYFTVLNNVLNLTVDQGDNSLFRLVKNNNGSYLIQSKANNTYLKYENSLLTLSNLIENDINFEFYFEEITNGLFIENSAEYTEDGKFIKSTTDSNFNKITYDIDTITGLTKSVTNAKNQTTYYSYNNTKQIIDITNGNKKVEYQYNNQNNLSKIVQENRVYNFSYDEFLNTKEIRIGENITLVTNNYEDNNGNLLLSKYGNNHEIKFDYDEFDRIKTTTKMNNIYHYKYGNNGDLIKVISNDGTIKYTYDANKRLYEYDYNNFNIRYKYDSNSNIIGKKYKVNNLEKKIDNNLNDDDAIIKTSFDEFIINYNYDSLGRLVKSNINDNFNTNYKYITNGKRTSLLVKSITNDNDKYSYRYDKLNNITHIHHNDILENSYYYDEYNELIKEDNYLLNQTIRYQYDNLGNILSKKIYELNTHNQLNENKYEYNNSNWNDQLTKFNNDVITYDEIGNPLTLGNNITLNWINGRQLNSYNNLNNTINYQYNKDGIRTSKEVNGVKTMYYLEGNNIIFEKTGNNVLYYMRNNIDDLIGFKYNNDVYYYIKNNQDDIIGILDSNYSIVAKYTYDSWGKAISITDGNGIDLSTDLTHIANVNPFRYRSYYYDKEVNLYYLNSRYYNPVWGRFINADAYLSTGIDILGYNMYIHANNNPINFIDTNGNFPKILKDIGNAAAKAAQKVANTVAKAVAKAVTTVAKAVIDNFVFEAGYGKGSSLSVTVVNTKVSLGGYQDITSGIKNKTSYTNISGEAGVTAGLGVSKNFTHEYPFDLNEAGFIHTPGDTVVIPNCPLTETNYSIDLPIGSFSTESYSFTLIDINIHFGIGFHIKLGWEVEY